MWVLVFSIGFIFSLLSATSAYVIIYNEYMRHFSSKKARTHALTTAVIAFVVVTVFSIVIAIFITLFL